MSSLAEVLELLHDAQPRWKTIRSAGREWSHTARSQQAFEAHIASMHATHPPGSVAVLRGYGPEVAIPDATEEHWRLWMEHAGRKRAEFSAGGEVITVVFDSPTWWSWSPRLGGRTNGGHTSCGHGAGPSAVLIDTAPLLSALRLEFLGDETLAGRAAYFVRGVPRDEDSHESTLVLHGLGAGADDYLLAVDAERGVLLRIEARLGEQPFKVVEMSVVEFDTDLPAETFNIELAAGEAFADASLEMKPWKRRAGPRIRFRRGFRT
jgi:outer membrane lipoprotein-sorting protein